MRIIHKFTLVILAVALLIWSVGYLAITKGQTVLQESIIATSQQIANDVLNNIDRNIYSRIEVLKEYSTHKILQDILFQSNSKDVSGYSPEGKVLLERLYGEIQGVNTFYKEEYGDELFTDVFVINKYGMTITESGPTSVVRHDKKDWWETVKDRGLFVSDFTDDSTKEINHLDIGIRINDKDGVFLGAIKGVLNISEAISILKELQKHALHKQHMTMGYLLINGLGDIVYSTEKQELSKDILDKHISSIANNTQHLHNNFFSENSPGERERLFIFAQSRGHRSLKGLGWTLIIGHDTEEIFAPVTSLRDRILLISLAITILLVLLGLYVSNSVCKSVTKLKNAAVEIGRGNMDVSINAESNDEIGQLSIAFKHMTEELQAATKELKDKNQNLSILYKISSAITRTIDIDDLLTTILRTITEIDILHVERKGGVFIINGESMELVSHLGHDDDFLDLHTNMKIGECLCGLAAEKGEIIISKNCDGDSRHTIRPPGILPHGHIIIPFHARGTVIGVIYLYLEPDIYVDEDKISLLKSIANQIGIVVDNARLYKEIKMDSLHDPLTGLANRRLMDIVFERNFARAKRLKQIFSVIILDIDHFKKYNDTYGHSAGDVLIAEIAKSILKEIREIDLAVRYGGEEFVVLLPEALLNDAYDVAERIRKTVESETSVTVSLGVSSFSDEMLQKEELINKADSVLYRAKNIGRNRVEVYS